MIASLKRPSFLLTALFVGNLLLCSSPAMAQEESESKKPDTTEQKLDDQESAEKKSEEKSGEAKEDSKKEAKDELKQDEQAEGDSSEAESEQEKSSDAKSKETDDAPKSKESMEADPAGEDLPEKPEAPDADETELLENGSFEAQTDGQPVGWTFPAKLLEMGCIFKLDEEIAHDGKISAFIDTTEAVYGENGGFAAFNQYLDPARLRGKRVKFRAAVRTDARAENGRAQLWLRVDRKPEDGKPVIGAFDNMGTRPIKCEDWEHFEIVADVDDDAERLVVGLLVIGKAKVWIDDASLEIVDEQTPTTTREIAGVARDDPIQDDDAESESAETDPTQDESPDSEPGEMDDEPESKDTAAADQTKEDSPAEPDTTEADNAELLKNGAFETETNDQPDGWNFAQRFRQRGCDFKLDDNNPISGKFSGLVDTTEAEFGVKNGYAILNQILDPVEIRGKRIRFRAAVRTAELAEDGRAQLWLRVDRPRQNSRPIIGAFDNMADRPITSNEWKHYEIVVDVDDDAERMTVGMLVFGNAKVWIDDASIEVVDDKIETTSGGPFGGSIAANAPQQPFFVGWLWLVLVALVLFAISQTRNSFLQRFALRFSIAYWLLYCFPTVIVGIIGSILGALTKFGVSVETASERLGKFIEGKTYYTNQVVHWVAANVFGIEGELILPNGSGDTTYAYIRVFVCFFGALAIALVWSSVYWRKADQTWLRDLLRTYLRYVLALTMLGYGLSKTGFSMTQFAVDGVPNEFQLTRTYGESSPMGLLWTFMAASPAYTFFAGLGEVIGGLLLVLRRTATLGALVVCGVMLNVMMMNFCYDVPVKQYSFHLLMMALLVVLPDLPRLANVLIWNRTADPSDLLIPPYTNSITIWFYRALQAIVILCAFALPVYDHVKKEIEFEREEAVESDHLLINRGFRWINEYPYNR